ncbi:MAG TPA: SsrA-binding protein SmpB [Candidatus Stercoripulliclostridium merdipullorum]|uniref:SsrA-binding protein n=1 Tax=Candidatus Stercoripulliclostridium merdipullorum TaxID=2840952 RepID=A0A9D1SX89_9FIRM|nr:SsrA-binding protein SmpB [Candidatus Stercoripulliclostridium merdipullorum]
MIKVVANNKKAFHDYFIETVYEAGIELKGSEVKSIRLGNVNLKDSYATIKDGEIFLVGAHISPYKMGSHFNPDPRRMRRLLLNRYEINKIRGKVYEKGYTLVVTKLYFKEALVKAELALAKGKEGRDKRRDLTEKQQKRDVERALKEINR